MGEVKFGGASRSGSVNVEGGGADSREDVAASKSLLGAVDELLLSGDPGAAIAALGIQAGREQRNAAQAQRRDAEALEASEQNAQIQALRDKADLTRVQGALDGAMTIGAGALELGHGLDDVASAKHTARAEELKADGLPFASAGEDLSAARVKGEGAWCKAGGALADGATKVADGFLKGAMTDKDTDAAVHEQGATRARHAVDDAMGNYDDAKKLLDKALDFYKEYTGAKNGAVSAAIHRA